jgi:PhnB protein
MAVKPIPKGYRSVTPYLMVDDAVKLVEFMKTAFNATETERMTRPDGRIAHAEVRIGDSMVMLGEARGDWKAMPATIYLYVPDVDATYKRALAAGGVSIMEPANQFYGDRHGAVKDPTGNLWWIATHVEDVSPEEMKRRAAAAMQVH